MADLLLAHQELCWLRSRWHHTHEVATTTTIFTIAASYQSKWSMSQTKSWKAHKPTVKVYIAKKWSYYNNNLLTNLML
jgi:hypothetical protein